MGRYRNNSEVNSEVRLILCWMSDNQVFRMDLWSISLRSTFGNYAKFGLPDSLDISRPNSTARARPQSRLVSSLPTVPTSPSRSARNESLRRATRFTIKSDTVYLSTQSYWKNYLHIGIPGILPWRFHCVYFFYLIASFFSYGGIHWTITFFYSLYSWFSSYSLARYKLCGAISFEFRTSKVSTGQYLGTWEIIPTLCALLHSQYINFISSTVRPLGSQLGHLFEIVWNMFCWK